MTSAKPKRFWLWDRRRRERRPIILSAIAFALVVMPFINLTWIVHRYNIPGDRVSLLWEILTLEQILFLLFMLPIGLGLYWVQRWAWFLFIIYSLALIGYNIAIFISHSSVYNLSATLSSFVLTLGVVYITSKDISGPFFHKRARRLGWRAAVRRPVSLIMTIAQSRKKVVNVSSHGAYIKWQKPAVAVGDEIPVKLRIINDLFQIKAAVVRVEKDAVALAFRYVTKRDRLRLERKLKEMERMEPLTGTVAMGPQDSSAKPFPKNSTQPSKEGGDHGKA